ncbi:MAG: hypothetical protein AB1546_08885 [bacterium]
MEAKKTTTPITTDEGSIVRKKAVKFTHDEIKERYRLENIRRIPNHRMNGFLKDISQADIDILEDLFLTTIYPEPDARYERDKSFESLIKMLKNPHKLTLIIPSLPSIALRHAIVFPTALRIGLNSVIAHSRSIKLENRLVSNLINIFHTTGKTITPSLIITPEEYFEAYRSIKYEEGKKMIDIAVWIVRAGKKKETVNSARAILSDVKDALDRIDEQNRNAGRQKIYPDDIGAIEYGIRTLDKISSCFDYFSPEKTDRLIKISHTVEMDYLNRNYGR